MIINLSIAVHALPQNMLTSLSLDVILLMVHMNWSTNVLGTRFNEEMRPY